MPKDDIELRDCCKSKLKEQPTIFYCPDCGNRVKENSDQPCEAGCKCCVNHENVQRSWPFQDGIFCPNCGRKTKNLLDTRRAMKFC